MNDKLSLEIFVRQQIRLTNIPKKFLLKALTLVNNKLYNGCCLFPTVPTTTENSIFITVIKQLLRRIDTTTNLISLQNTRYLIEKALGYCCNQGTIFGNYFDESFITNDSTFTLNPVTSTFTINNGLNMSGGSVNFDSYAIYNQYNIGPNHTITVDFTFTGIQSTTSYGIFVGKLSEVTYNPCQYNFQPIFTQGATSGQLALRMRAGGDYNNLTAQSTTGIQIIQNAKYRLQIQLNELNLLGVFSRLDNNGNVIESTSTSYNFVLELDNDGSRYTPNTSRYYVGLLGGSFTITRFKVDYLLDYKGSNVVFVGDSITEGIGSSGIPYRYVNQVFDNVIKNFVVVGGPGDASTNILLRKQEVVDFQPVYAVIASSVLDNNYSTLYNNLLSMCNFFMSNNIIPILLGQSTNPAVKQAVIDVANVKGLKYIEIANYLLPQYMADFYHPNDEGHALMGTIIKTQAPELIY